MSDGSEFQTVRAATLKPREVKYYHSGSNSNQWIILNNVLTAKHLM